MRIERKARTGPHQEVKCKVKLNTKTLVFRDEGVTEALTTVCEHPVVFSNDPYSFKLI